MRPTPRGLTTPAYPISLVAVGTPPRHCTVLPGGTMHSKAIERHIRRARLESRRLDKHASQWDRHRAHRQISKLRRALRLEAVQPC